ncbi:hypothetical protein AAF712_013873 [Marasmius tenuissimus]|uniref:Uncharacterized protein n=1 Tax=Marasmius tenuissimus TaxID=585030 RepID=A0ABR2ZDQ1_9AGAR
MFIDTASHRVLPLLHTVSFNLLNEKRSAQELDDKFVSEIMKSYPMLRRISVDWRRWEGSWASYADGSIHFLVQEVKS